MSGRTYTAKQELIVLTLKAYAKVNLVLEVLGRRGDGYHEVVGIMQAIGLHDILTFEAADDISFSCSAPELQTGDNLVLKAVHALREATAEKAGARITLEKKIPLAAGLGGGSSDAAAVLKGLNRLWGLGLAAEKLAEIAAGTGSDVPFFIYGGTCLAQGRGEKITPLPDIRGALFVLLKPDVAVPVNKTAALYGMLKPGHYSGGALASGAAERLKNGETGVSMLYNTFDNVAAGAYNGLGHYRESLAKAGAGDIHLAGSGPLLFSMFSNQEDALAMREKLALINVDSILAPGIARDAEGY
jgi:4-diphosphocytidyl-2-C-methyl-D-erythritol kinase